MVKAALCGTSHIERHHRGVCRVFKNRVQHNVEGAADVLAVLGVRGAKKIHAQGYVVFGDHKPPCPPSGAGRGPRLAWTFGTTQKAPLAHVGIPCTVIW